ncbi:hypothetical protein [Hymenobacter metallicola]|uniref:Uncharacterized protein n=1 Tax=Hymenobacter metallicola TaxID=2563114 RepID=A0A4Z0Q463_9BACT|nr:hypothetical protein [Hymenobacter metallicola]TGE23512.1 hypothetical protein E5K02_20205 [Hymenobacter metallicola]
MTTANTFKQAFTEHDERVHNILTRVGSEFSGAAHFLAEYGMSTHLAQQVTEMLQTPLSFFVNQHVYACQQIAFIMRKVVVDHIRTVAEDATVTGLWEVQRGNDETTMEYTVALREYTLEKRAMLRSFKNDYEETELADLAPLVFHLIPEKRSVDINNEISKAIELQ